MRLTPVHWLVSSAVLTFHNPLSSSICQPPHPSLVTNRLALCRLRPLILIFITAGSNHNHNHTIKTHHNTTTRCPPQHSGLDMDQPGNDGYFAAAKLEGDEATLTDMATRIVGAMMQVRAVAQVLE
jgi:hypothetical protein